MPESRQGRKDRRPRATLLSSLTELGRFCGSQPSVKTLGYCRRLHCEAQDEELFVEHGPLTISTADCAIAICFVKIAERFSAGDGAITIPKSREGRKERHYLPIARENAVISE
jgi:hypothetical protein